MSPSGDPHGESLVASAFASLQTNQCRQSALDQLLDLLQPNEWRRIYNRASKTLQRDIIGCLPLELVVEITTYLDLRDILSLQRVSKQWQARLSSSAVYRSVLRFYCVPETEKNLSTKAFRTFAEQRYNLETGTICCEDNYPWLDGPDYSLDTATLGLVSYCSGKVAWVSRNNRSAIVRDLRADSTAITEFVPETRGSISTIHISESFLFVQASGHCTVWNLATEHSTSVRIPSSSLLEVNIRDNHVAMILQSPVKQHTLYSWNLISGSLRSVDLDANPMFTHWEEDASVITVIELDLPEALSRFFRKKYSTANDNLILIESKLLLTKPRHSPSSYGPLTTAFRYNQYLCRYGTAVTQYLPGENLDAPMFISYRTSTGHLTVSTIDGDPMNTRLPNLNINQSRLMSPEGLVYSPSMTNELKLYNVFAHGITRPPNFPPDYQDLFQGVGSLTFGNHQLYGVIGSKGISIWYFDQNLVCE